MRKLPLLLLVLCCYRSHGQQTTHIPQGHLLFDLPNDKWHPSQETDSTHGVYFFKREAVTDKEGRSIIPAIMFFIEDAKTYHQDVVEYSIVKRMPFMKNGVSIDQTLIHTDKGYPLTYANALFMKASYTQDSIGHVIYMIHIINKQDQGIQLYLDMTKDLGDAYEKEFFTTMRSLRADN